MTSLELNLEKDYLLDDINSLEALDFGDSAVFDSRISANVRISSRSNESLFFALAQNYFKITKQAGKGNLYYWMEFQKSPCLQEKKSRFGVHLIGKGGGWQEGYFETQGGAKNSALLLPLKNFGRHATLYLYPGY